jgi:hypothetical protein
MVVKRNKRVLITADDGEVVYAAPDFLRVPNRAAFRDLADDMTARGRIAAVMAFEERHHKGRRP